MNTRASSRPPSVAGLAALLVGLLVALGLVAVAAVLGGCGAGGASGAKRVAKAGDTVSVHYTGTLDDGSQFDSSKGREPLAFTVGAGQMIAGFDRAVVGMGAGEKKTVHLAATEAYGERRSDLVVTVPAAQAPAGLKVGQRVQLGNGSGLVTAVTAESVTVDANHALAGKPLNFAIEIVSIK